MDLSKAMQQIQHMWGVFLDVGKGFVWDRDLVCVSGGCMVWNSIMWFIHALSLAMSRMGFVIL